MQEILDKRKNILFIISSLFRIIALAFVLAPFGLTIWEFLHDPEGFGSPLSTFTLLSMGPFLISSGIVLSFFYKKRPAILRIETALGLFILFAVGIVAMFSVGLYFLAAGLLALILLITDQYLWKEFTPQVSSKINDVYSQPRYAILLIPLLLTLAILLFINIPVFIVPIISIAVPCGFLLFKSLEANLPGKWYAILAPFLIVLLFAGNFFYQKNSRPALTAVMSKNEIGLKSEGGMSNGGGGLLQSDEIDLNYEDIKKHSGHVKFKLNDDVYFISEEARTLIYGQVHKNKVAYVVLVLKNNRKKTTKVKNDVFATWLPQPHSEKNISKVQLLDQDIKVISTKNIE